MVALGMHVSYMTGLCSNRMPLSCSCIPNVKSIIGAHNKRVLQTLEPEVEPEVEKSCNCKKKKEDQCPLDNQCPTKDIIYQATVTSSEGNEYYVGLTDTDFNARFANHTQSFKNLVHNNQTELSKYMWRLKNAKVNYNITWKILGRARAYSKRCNLCTLEKYYTICHPELSTLNKRSELASGCLHANKFLLKKL